MNSPAITLSNTYKIQKLNTRASNERSTKFKKLSLEM